MKVVSWLCNHVFVMRPFEHSESAVSLINPRPSADELVKVAKNAWSSELFAIVRQWLSEGIPYAFAHRPFLYETTREFLASRIGIHPKQVTIIGSARLGYSLAPGLNFGKAFNEQSDLDFSAISDDLFERCVNDFRQWRADYKGGTILPAGPRQEGFWKSNFLDVPHNIDRGFIDPWKIPYLPRYHIAQKIGDAMSFVYKKLKVTPNSPSFSKISIRVYKDWYSFVRQVHLNFLSAIRNL